jgi:hypothetical protein
MDDREIRVRCIEAAVKMAESVRASGYIAFDPLDKAKQFYAWATEPAPRIIDLMGVKSPTDAAERSAQ